MVARSTGTMQGILHDLVVARRPASLARVEGTLFLTLMVALLCHVLVLEHIASLLHQLAHGGIAVLALGGRSVLGLVAEALWTRSVQAKQSCS